MGNIHLPKSAQIDNEWVSEGLGDEFKTWRSQWPVLISAQTGAGKNHFILDRLIPYAIKTNQQVFLFSNRVALSVQQKRELLHKVSYPDIFSNSELERMDSFGPIHIVNYQSALGFLHQFGYDTPLGTSPLAGPLSRGFAVFDEAYFFLSDSLFNSATSRILERLIFVFSGYVRIYMTATADDLLPILNHLEMSNEASELLTHCDLTDTDRPQRSRAMYVYEFPRGYWAGSLSTVLGRRSGRFCVDNALHIPTAIKDPDDRYCPLISISAVVDDIVFHRHLAYAHGGPRLPFNAAIAFWECG